MGQRMEFIRFTHPAGHDPCRRSLTAVIGAAVDATRRPVAVSALAAGLGILAVVLILFRIISPPDFGAPDSGVDLDVGRGIGVFLGLIAAGGVAYGGWVAMQEEGTSFSMPRPVATTHRRRLRHRHRRPAAGRRSAGSLNAQPGSRSSGGEVNDDGRLRAAVALR